MPPSNLSSNMLLISHLLVLISFASAQLIPATAGPDPLENFCSRWWSQSAVKNDVLYIDSGVQQFGTKHNAKGSYFGNMNYMLKVPLTNSWDWKAEKNDPYYLDITAERTNVTNHGTGTGVPNMIRGHMFHGPQNTTDVYIFGGTTYMYNQTFEGKTKPDTRSAYPLWTYTPGLSPESAWNQYSSKDPMQLPNHGAGADAIDLGLGFYLNGQIDEGTSGTTAASKAYLNDNHNQTIYQPLMGMMVLDLVNNNTVANISTAKLRGGVPRVGGTLEYVAPIGDKGILVALGGQIQPQNTGKDVAKIDKGELIDFNSVDVFDIDSYLKDPTKPGTWYQQNTTGDIPPPRIDFCSVSISAPDNSSHHIYMYGGYNPTGVNNTIYDDVVILSLPSFKWSSVWNGTSFRRFHNCHVAGKRQMITVGGYTSGGCDWESKSLAVWEMSTSKWGSVYWNNLTDYEVPKKALTATGGMSNGSAKVGEPATGWVDEGLHALFWKSRWTVPTTWTSEPPAKTAGTTGTTPGSSKESEKPKGTNVAAISGGATGAVIALLLALGGAIFYIRRKRRNTVELDSDSARGLRARTDKFELEDGSSIKYELQGINENNPSELPGPPVGAEADHDAAVRAAELPATNMAPGGVAGVPIVRTPGDDLPERPEYRPGLQRPASSHSPRGRRRSTFVATEKAQGPT